MFPNGFLWGASTASAQIEGGFDEDGKTLSIWDAAPSSRIKTGENCHIADDHYHRYKEDVALMKELGLKSYRFSVSWPRIVPEENTVNPKGIAFYGALVDELLKNGIEPIVTLYHWDLPLWLQEKGGWRNKEIIQHFAFYTKAVIQELSDRVTWWLTMNEPQCFVLNGYLTKVHAPFECRPFSISAIIKNVMLANKDAVDVIRKYAVLPPKVGLSFGSGAFIPEDETDENSIEKARQDSFYRSMGSMNNRLWFDPMLSGKSVSTYLIYHVGKKTAKRAKTDFDFLALNNYEAFNYSPWGVGKTDRSKLKTNSLGWTVDGRSLYWTCRFIYERYHLPILITENGYCDEDILTDNAVNDPERISYMDEYIAYVGKAIGDGVPILGYHYWSFMDNFEWAEGFTPRFGLVYVDYKTQKRIPKRSAYRYKEIIETNGTCLGQR